MKSLFFWFGISQWMNVSSPALPDGFDLHGTVGNQVWAAITGVPHNPDCRHFVAILTLFLQSHHCNLHGLLKHLHYEPLSSPSKWHYTCYIRRRSDFSWFLYVLHAQVTVVHTMNLKAFLLYYNEGIFTSF